MNAEPLEQGICERRPVRLFDPIAADESIGGLGHAGTFRTIAFEKGRQKIRLGHNGKTQDANGEKWTESSDFVKMQPMLGEGKPVEEPIVLATAAPRRVRKSESFQDWFRGSKVGFSPL